LSQFSHIILYLYAIHRYTYLYSNIIKYCRGTIAITWVDVSYNQFSLREIALSNQLRPKVSSDAWKRWVVSNVEWSTSPEMIHLDLVLVGDFLVFSHGKSTRSGESSGIF